MRALLCLLCLGGTAWALTPADEAEYARCTQAFRAKNYSQALQCYEAFETRMRAGDEPAVVAKAMLRRAFTLEKLGRSGQAIEVYGVFLNAAATTSKDRDFAERHRAELLRTHGPQLSVACPAGLKLRVDDGPPQLCPVSQLSISPGSHHLTMLDGTTIVATRQIEARPGMPIESKFGPFRRVRLLGDAADVQVGAARVGPTPVSVWLPHGPQTIASFDEAGRRQQHRIAVTAATRQVRLDAIDSRASGSATPWIVTGVSAAVAVGGAIVLVSQLPGKQDEQAAAQARYDAALGPASAFSARQALEDAHADARQVALVGWVATGVGLAGTAVGLWWALDADDDDQAHWIAPAVGGAVWGGRW